MSVLLRLNLVVGACLAASLVAVGLLCRSTLVSSARGEVLAQAGLMLDSAQAMRTYTANEIAPLLSDKLRTEFVPQSVPFYAATQDFLVLHERHPQYSYKEATLNPTNLRDRATDWEADIIQRFRNEPAAQELSGERDTATGPALYLARPIRVVEECLSCHSLPARAPQTVIARYGSNNGFGWQRDEVIGAQIVSVPLTSAVLSADRNWRIIMGSLSAVLIGLTLLVNALTYVLVVRPLRVSVRVADQLSRGDTSAASFPQTGAAEIVSLGQAFERMRRSLEKALELITLERPR